MIYPAESDIMPFLKSLTQGLQPYAQANEVQLSFSATIKKQVLPYHPFLLSQSIVQLICNIINLMPPKSIVKVRVLQDDEKYLTVEIENTGINLIRLNEICTQGIYTFTGYPLINGTIYRLPMPLQQNANGTANQQANATASTNNLPQFYKEVQKRFLSHFTQTEKLMATLEKSQPQEAAFMQKINALIKVNLENENFDTIALCKAMSLSRTQLFRRLKSLIKQAPANHIKIMRLQKAKELLETTDDTISQITFKTGFQTISHFTKIFKKQYGVVPSAYRQTNGHATNE